MFCTLCLWVIHALSSKTWFEINCSCKFCDISHAFEDLYCNDDDGVILMIMMMMVMTVMMVIIIMMTIMLLLLPRGWQGDEGGC